MKAILVLALFAVAACVVSADDALDWYPRQSGGTEDGEANMRVRRQAETPAAEEPPKEGGGGEGRGYYYQPDVVYAAPVYTAPAVAVYG